MFISPPEIFYSLQNVAHIQGRKRTLQMWERLWISWWRGEKQSGAEKVVASFGQKDVQKSSCTMQQQDTDSVWDPCEVQLNKSSELV